MKLTQNRIDAIFCPAGKRDVMVFDEEQKGLAVRVTATGSKSFLAQYTYGGVKRRVPLGSCAGVSLASARLATAAILGDVAKGLDPAMERRKAAEEAKRQAASSALTLGVLINKWSAKHLSGQRPGYAAEAVRALRFGFSDYLDHPAADIDLTIIKKVEDKIRKRGSRSTADRTLAYGRACYGWGLSEGELSANPFLGLKIAPPRRRERVLTDQEIVAVWNATDNCGVYGGIVRLLILTGQRREEVAGIAWSELSENLSSWELPGSRTKNGVAHIVPLSKPARDLIGGLQKIDDILALPGIAGTFKGWSKAKSALDLRSGVTEWRLHDLRRTVATGLQRLGVRREVVEKTLNHVSQDKSGIAGIYQRYDFADERRAALEAWGDYVLALVEHRTMHSKVLPMKRA